jgi:hypothetical protein
VAKSFVLTASVAGRKIGRSVLPLVFDQRDGFLSGFAQCAVGKLKASGQGLATARNSYWRSAARHDKKT